MVGLKFHDLANLFPLIDGEKFQALVTDIKKNGLLEPIKLYEGKILDGRNRYHACEEAGVKARTKQYKGTDPTAFVLSMNLERRHLTKSQRAFVALNLLPVMQKEATKRLNTKGGHSGPVILPEAIGDARDKAGSKVHVSGSYVNMAAKVRDKAPELEDLTFEGSLPMPQAHALAKVTIESVRARALVRVIADKASLPETLKIIRDEGPRGALPKLPPKNKGTAIVQLSALLVEIRKIYKQITSGILLDTQIKILELTLKEIKQFRKDLND